MELQKIDVYDYSHQIFRIIHHGTIVNALEMQLIYDDSNESCYVSENFNFNNESDDFWKSVLSKYQNKMLLTAIVLRNDPIITFRVSTKNFIDSTHLKKLCFVFHRNDNGRILKEMNREVVINVRDINGNIAARSVLTGLHGYNIRGKITIPTDINEFRIEIKLKMECEKIPDNFTPSCILSISDMWLEHDIYNERVESLNDSSDPEIPDDNPNDYAHAVTPETLHGIPYTKIWFNEEGIIYRGEHTYASEIPISAEDDTSIRDKVEDILSKLPKLENNKIMIIDNGNIIKTEDKPDVSDIPYLLIGENMNIECEPLPEIEN